jgi:hypothetical protein
MKTTKDNLEERQAEIGDVLRLVDRLEEELRNAESCEMPRDFDANTFDAIETAREIIAALKELRGQTSGARSGRGESA